MAGNNKFRADQLFPSINRRQFLFASGASAGVFSLKPSSVWAEAVEAAGIDSLRSGFIDPPMRSRPWVYFWWLEGVVTPEGLTADLEEMKKQGIAGVLVFDAGRTGPSQVKGAKFMSNEWRANFRHTVREAARLGMEVSVSLCTGWDAGGFWVERDDAIQVLTWRELEVSGPHTLTEKELTRQAELKAFGGPLAKVNPQNWSREIAVLACPADSSPWTRDKARVLPEKTVDHMRQWNVPAGKWTVMQFGYTLSAKLISLPSSDQPGWELDPMNRHALDQHFQHTAALLIEDAGEHAGKTFKFTHIDSWEIGQPTWNQQLAAEFQKRRGYDPTPYLPALAGKTVDSEDVTRRFQYDVRRVIADLVQENYYTRLTQLSNQHQLGTHSEAGGPFYTQYVDGLACLGADTIPMAEFWATLPGRIIQEGVSDPFFQSADLHDYASHIGSVRQAATAARIYGKPFCQAESFTGFDRDWTEDPYYLKAYGDRAFCVGLGRIVIHHYASVPDFHNPPGSQWEHVSIHFNRYLTWWDKCHAWLKYLGRCQYLLRQGNFVADILYYSGETVPNFVLIDRKPVEGFDFDTTNAQALLAKASFNNGGITFGTGTTYRYFAIPGKAGEEMSLPVLSKLRDLVRAGMTLIASRPQRVPGLAHYQESDRKLGTIADELWGSGSQGEKKVGKGRVIWGKSVEDVLAADGVKPDLEIRGASSKDTFDWIHRRSDAAEIYFIANNSEDPAEIECTFRVSRNSPQIWNAVTGQAASPSGVHQNGGRTVMPMKFAPKESFFVIFPSAGKNATSQKLPRAFPELTPVSTLDGSWDVHFDPAWGGPSSIVFDHLQDWTKNSDDGIRYYSGQATYQKTFTFTPPSSGRCYLDLGEVKNVAQVFLNGANLGVVWTAPWRV